MPSFAANFTGRYKAKYKVAGVEHVIQVRSPRGASLSSIASEGRTCLFEIFSAVVSILADDFVWISAEVADQNSNTFLPTTPPSAVTGTVDFVAGLWSARKRVSALTFSGRAEGSKGRISMYGLDIDGDLSTDIGADGLVTPAELSDINTIVASLNGRACAGSGDHAIYSTQATHKVNDRLLRDVRKGTIS